MKTRFILALAVVLGAWVGQAHAVIIGAPEGIDPFILTFDENGHGTVQRWLGNAYGDIQTNNGTMVPDLITGIPYLTFNLPELVSVGDVGVWETGQPGVLSDGLRFLRSPNNSGLMQFFSDVGDSDLADTGFPTDFQPGVWVQEQVDGTFLYVAGNGDPSFTNFYHGRSDSDIIPEPATLVVWSVLGALGVAFGWWRRRG